jgi:hypothetical protein
LKNQSKNIIDNKRIIKIAEVLSENGFEKYEEDDFCWFSKNKKYFATIGGKTVNLSKRINNNEYVIIEEKIFPSNLIKLLKKYEVNNV